MTGIGFLGSARRLLLRHYLPQGHIVVTVVTVVAIAFSLLAVGAKPIALGDVFLAPSEARVVEGPITAVAEKGFEAFAHLIA